MTRFNLTFNPSGIGTCFYTEAIDLSSIGVLEISRATTIEFNSGSRTWEVKNIEGEILFENASRQTCLLWEQNHFNQG